MHDELTQDLISVHAWSATREDILKVAVELFAKTGFERMRMADLAERCHLEEVHITYLVGSKTQLWLAVVDYLERCQRGYLPEEKRPAHVTTGMDSSTALFGVIRLLIRMVMSMPLLPAFVLTEQVVPGERARVVHRQLLRPVQKLLYPVFRAAVADRLVVANRFPVFCSMLLSAIHINVFLFYHLKPKNLIGQQDIARMSHVIVRSLSR